MNEGTSTKQAAQGVQKFHEIGFLILKREYSLSLNKVASKFTARIAHRTLST
jgi:hypothetical protein